MSVQETLYTVDDFLEFVNAPENEHQRFELIDGVIMEMPDAGALDIVIAGRIIYYPNAFVLPDNLGFVSVPDAAFISRERIPKLAGKVFPVFVLPVRDVFPTE